MAYQVLSTKLYTPPIQPSLVQRLGLVQRMENGYQAGKQMTLVSAPAGFGKTTIIREWITGVNQRKPFGWLSLDDGDNDPVRFLVYLVSAMQQVHAEIGRSVLASLQSSQIPPLLDLIETLINDISSSPAPFLIVLDDYHLIKEAEIHSLMQLFLKRQPGVLHLVIMTREDPPLPLPKMRVEGLITEIRERDLRFSNEEAGAFLLTTMGLDLSSSDILKLKERTEGWAAGMQLAALALEEFPTQAARHAFIEEFTGSNRLIVDYLISEVLHRQPEPTQQFLLRTSILERFCADLCNHVVFKEANPGHSQAILDSLEQGNMFLVPLDNQRRWYRYHHLFRDMLWHSLCRTLPDQTAALHCSASEWFEAQRFIPEAMQHALASRDWTFVRAVLDRQALPMLVQGNVNLVIEWCRELPKAFMEKSPDICIYYAWALVLTFRNDFLDSVEEKLQMASRAIEMPDLPAFATVGEGGARVPYKDWVIGQTCVIRSQILLGRFNTYVDPQELITLSLKGLELLPEVEHTFRSTCKINLAIAQLMQNNASDAQEPLEEALKFMLEAGNILGAVTNIVYQARLAFYTGQLERAESLCQEWKSRLAEMAVAPAAGEQSGTDIPTIRGLDIMQALICLETNRLDEGDRLLVQALEQTGWSTWIELHGFIALARLQFLRGHDKGLQETLQRMSRLGPQHAACAEAYRSLYAIRKLPSDPQVRAKVDEWGNTHAPDSDRHFALGIGPYHCDTEYYCNLAWVRVQIALGHPEAASGFIKPALEESLKQGLAYRFIELSIAQALAYGKQGNPPAAIAVLEKALEVGAKHGYSRVFDDGPELDRLLHQAIERKTHARYARQLLASFDRMPAGGKPAGSASRKKGQPELIDPLSERELEVLRLLARGFTPADVAKQLFLSPFTLKAHTQNIYSKLEVHSRVEAINKARDLGLI